MIYKVDSLMTAERVVDLVLNNTDLVDVWGYVEAYQNGREQGLLIYFDGDKCLYICEHRNGDQPTVYCGRYSMQSLSDDAYSRVNTFVSCEHAAKWITAQLLEWHKLKVTP